MKNKEIKHLLVIRLSAMGDVAISVPVLTAFSEQYPKVQLTILTRPLFAPMFAHLPHTTLFPIEVKGKHKGVKGLYHLFKELRNRQIQGVADLHNVLRTNILKFFFSFTPIPFKQINKGRKEKRALTRAKKKVFSPLLPTYKRYADVFKALGFPLSLDSPYFAPKPPLSQEIKNLLSSTINIGIAPFATHKGKEYPFDQMKEVIIALAERYPLGKIFIFGGGNREKELVASLPSLENIENIIGRFSFEKELSLIAHLSLMLAMDSGNAHLAAMYGIPTLTLWGVTHPYTGFAPYGQPQEYCLLASRELFPLIPTSVFGNKYPKGYEKSITTISNQDILKKIITILEK
ncbi:glycosyltransferase family 9 protein [Capnocytophaga sp. G2]|uniref:glycosyltransferase family 9 protein n=1 Tax=Capnocytophaga sp. G2 TaxID=3110695 RepID=UPI002B47D4F4|nr:glycosyltransferase family 9 protein [Capnocytophaga sp. G2]MEB3005506.1 glycosyltransferase family 9 protein [Capnocytophaga sp. G2]